MERVQTRFAPSPTGDLHIGGARTALFSWAFARRHGGRLILRIEDTDRERSSPAAEAAVLDALTWLGVEWDEGPYRQSERSERYAEAIERLLASGRAYRCICTPAELEERRRVAVAAGRKWTYDGRCRDAGHGADCGPHTVRLRLPTEGRFEWNDAVFGPSGQEARELGDRIIRRSDGGPLYHLAVVVDDIEMGITHVIRGADHHSNTPLQLALYQALGARLPCFAHVPLVVGPEGRKLSTRHQPVAVRDYREQGYLADAVRNWLVRFGWSHGDQEIFSREEVAALFDLAAIRRAPARAEPGKLQWLNHHYIKTLPRETLLRELRPFLEAEAGRPVEVTRELEQLVELLRERSRTLREMATLARFLVVEDEALELDERAARRHLKPEIEPILTDLRNELASLPTWSEAALEQTFGSVRARHGNLPIGRLAQAVRVAVVGRAASPGIYETLGLMGQARTLARLARALDRMGGR